MFGGRRGVNFLVDLSGIERRVMVVADGDGYGVGGRRLEAPSPAHKVLREGCLCVEIDAESSSSGAASVGPAAAASAARSSGVGLLLRSSAEDIVVVVPCMDMSSGVEFV